MPALVVGGVTTSILQVSQLAVALGLPIPPSQNVLQLASETLPVLRSWVDHLRRLDPDLLVKPTRSRGRNLRVLTVNVFHPFDLLPAAWSTGSFPWEPERDNEREALLGADDLVPYADGILARWDDFVRENAADLERREPSVQSPRGSVGFSILLQSQRDHLAFHYEQLTDFLQG